MPIGQFGAPFLIYKDKKSQREWANDEHGCFAAYLGPVQKTIDQHFFYRFETKRICIRDSYHVLQKRPSEWDVCTQTNDKIFKILYEKKELLEDMYLPFDGSEVLTKDTPSTTFDSSNEYNVVPIPIASSSHGMTLQKRIRIIEDYNSDDSYTDDNKEVMHVLPQ